MRPWRLLIEFGPSESDEPAKTLPVASPTPELDEGKAWSLLKDARAKMLESSASGRREEAAQANTWIGGGLALLASITGKDGNELLAKLTQEVTTPTMVASSTPEVASTNTPSGKATFYTVDRSRPKPHPGAPRAVDPSELTPEERGQLGIDTSSNVEGDSSASGQAKKKAPAKKVPAKKKAAPKARKSTET